MIAMGGREANEFVQRHAHTHLRSRRSFMEFRHAMEADRAMISMDGHDHMKLRRTAQAGYSRAVIEGSMDTAIEIVRRAVASWPVGRPLSTFRSMQQIVAEHLGVLATGHSPTEYVEDPKYWFDSHPVCRAARPPEGHARVPAAQGATEDQGAVPPSDGTACP